MNIRILFGFFLLLSTACCSFDNSAIAASTRIFGVTFGQTTEDSLKTAFPDAVNVGFNENLKGNIYSIPLKNSMFDGIKRLFVLFDQNKNAVALYAQIKGDNFGIISAGFSKKYKVILKKKSLIGSEYTELYNDNVSIYLTSPFFLFDMSLFYIKKEQKENLLKKLPESTLKDDDKTLNFMMETCFPSIINKIW